MAGRVIQSLGWPISRTRSRPCGKSSPNYKKSRSQSNMTQPTSFGSQSPANFITAALKATTSSDVETLLSQLPITPEDEYNYDPTNPSSGWRPGYFHWIPVGGDRGNAGRIKQANQPVNPIAERAVNGMEALIEMARQRELLANPPTPAPSSPRDAVLRYFGLPALDRLPKLDDS